MRHDDQTVTDEISDQSNNCGLSSETLHGPTIRISSQAFERTCPSVSLSWSCR